jgi:hypothetical protein
MNLEAGMFIRLRSFIFLATLFLLCGLAHGASDSTIEAKTKEILRSMGINVDSVRIADGRAKGGERALIVTYKQNDKGGEGNAAEIVQVLEAGYGANKHMNADLNSVVAVVGDRNGTALGVVGVKVADAQWFMKTKDSLGYLKRWSVKRLSPKFLPTVSQRMGW